MIISYQLFCPNFIKLSNQSVMKYPINQQQIFEQFVKQISVHIKPSDIGIHTLYFMCYQQHAEGNSHNWLYCVPNRGLMPKFMLLREGIDINECSKFFECEVNTFELYPIGINDNHIETMVKYTLKKLGIS